jgi:hypothetical protein
VALEDTAETLIAKFGRAATLLKHTGVSANPAAPWDGAASEGVSTAIKAVFVNFKADQIDGTVIQAGDVSILVAAKATADIGTDDTIIDGDRRWRIIAASLVKPGAVSYLWKLQARS